MTRAIVKRVRPGMPPISVRLEVAERQVEKFGCLSRIDGLSNAKCLKCALDFLFGDTKFNLDHDPALARRLYNPRIKKVAARYTPHAHDPRYLVYLEKTEEHDRKTFGRGRATTLGSDFHEIAKTKRLEREAAGLPKRKRKSRPFQSRPFPKGRGFGRRPS